MGPKHGVAVGDVLAAMGVEVDGEPEQVERSIEEVGFGYMRAARFLPDLYALKPLREELALRTSLHTIEKLYNLAGAAYSIIGLTHVPYLEKMLEASKQMGFRRVMILQGIEGSEDAPTSRPCRVFEFRDGDLREYRINPQEYGLTPASPEELAGGDVGHSAQLLRQVLEGKTGAHRDLVLLNAGIRLYLAERAGDIGEGIDRAREAIDSGAARSTLESLRQRAVSRV
jgi:anthranilate phosphoribosyltransferase